ncbi:MAG: N-acetylneuraminate synthase [Bacteroidales bacterium]|nr:N-acetylneuraminate synthase [Bacteroidales bacterium]
MSISTKTYIIAEAGVNHNGDINMAKRLIEVAKAAGADAVKFQTFKTELLVSKNAPKADYQKATTDAEENQFDMIKKLELSVEDHAVLMDYCREIGIEFLSSPFDLESIDLLHEIGLPLFKIPSGEITNLPYLKKIAAFNKRVILSTGMSTLVELKEAVNLIVANGTDKNKITLLHCNTEYPTPYVDVNLKAMQTLKAAFNVEVGYSDHTQGIEVSIAAVALGATVIEKHFTLDKSLPGPDQLASLDPQELKQMVDSIRHIEKALGNGVKEVSASENKNIAIARKSIVAAVDIKKGELFSEKNITVKRPGNGISPMKWESVLGEIAKRDFLADELIEL